MARMDVYIGCSGFYYKHWKNIFYPEKLPVKKWLEHYAQVFDTVEINATYYRWPKKEMLQSWVQRTPDDFQFVFKVNRRITHYKKMSRTKTAVNNFYKIKSTMKNKMGCFLFQFPPWLPYDRQILMAIVKQVDPKQRNVVEFRHKSWWRPAVFKEFKKKGIIFCSVDAPRLPNDIIKTSDILYIRMHGRKKWYHYNYSTDELSALAKKIKAAKAKEVWVYFNNDVNADAPRNAVQLRELLAERPRQLAPAPQQAEA